MAFGKKSNDAVVINAPNFRVVQIPIRGTSIYVCNAFSGEAQTEMSEKQAKGSVDSGKRNKKAPKDFDAQYKGSLHVSAKGWHGIPVMALKASMVRAASLCGIEMTRTKMCVFVEADGYQKDGQGLVKLTSGKPERFDSPVRNANGAMDIRARGRYEMGWAATVTVKYDADFLSVSSVVNLLMRAGISVGVGAGRPASTMSSGQGWGTFEVIQGKEFE